MTPETRWIDLPPGRFRALEWAGGDPPVLFLHGLTGVAEVWGPTVAALGDRRPRCIAIDQRGHGHSAKPDHGYDVGAFVRDAVGVMRALGLDRPHLVGHSMGARVAIVAAARHPELFRSVSIVDIGPEAWRANWVESVEAFDAMPATYPDAETAIGNAGRSRPGETIDAALGRPGDDALRDIALARLRDVPGGGVTWLADRAALKETVRIQRSRDYWRAWEALEPPALLIRGGRSRELRERIADEMRRRNPRVQFVEFAGVGHNIPLLAPGLLAATLRDFWG